MITEFDTVTKVAAPGGSRPAVLDSAHVGDIDHRVIAVVEQLTLQTSRRSLFGSVEIAAAMPESPCKTGLSLRPPGPP